MKRLHFLLLACSFATAMFAANAEVAKVSPSDAFSRVSAGEAVLVDVREPAEWAESGVAAPAELLPMSDFDGDQKLWKPFLEKNAGKELILYCRSGNRSGKVAAKLEAKGHKVGNGGAFKDWAAAGLPVRKVEPSE
jgi:rhodanese-related sulfurtransferase